MNNSHTVLLCGGKKCCPEMSLTESGDVKIKDDHGGTVIMKVSQAKEIDRALKELKEKSKS